MITDDLLTQAIRIAADAESRKMSRAERRAAAAKVEKIRKKLLKRAKIPKKGRGK